MPDVAAGVTVNGRCRSNLPGYVPYRTDVIRVSSISSGRKGYRSFTLRGHGSTVDAVRLRAMKSAALPCQSFDRVSDTVLEPEGNNMSKLLIALFVAAGLGVAGCE